MWLYLLIGACIGGLSTTVTMSLIFYKADKYVGFLRVDNSIPEESPYMFLELVGATPQEVCKLKNVRLKVKHENLLSQE